MRTPLAIAVERGDMEMSVLLIKSGADVDTFDHLNFTPLHRAVTKNNISLIGLLLDFKACMNTTESYDGESPLFTAVSLEYLEATTLLIHRGVDLEQSNLAGYTALHRACQLEALPFVKLLIQHGAKKDRKATSFQYTPLHISTIKSNMPIVKFLLESGCSVHIEDNAGKTALIYAIDRSDVSIVNVLLAFQTKSLPWTVLYRRCEDEEIRMVIFNAALANSHVDEMLLESTRKGHLEQVKQCLESCQRSNVLTDAVDEMGCSSLHIAVAGGFSEVVEVLLNVGVDMEASAQFGMKPLLRAVEKGYIDILSLLLVRGANVNSTDDSGHTALHIACKKGNLEAVIILMENHADLSSITYDGSTALHISAHGNWLQIVRYLVDKGADLNATDSNHQLPYDVSGNETIKDFLLGTSLKNGNVDKIILSVAKEGRVEKVLYCLKLDSTCLEAKDYFGFTPLLYAAAKGHLEVVQLLLEKGGNKEATAKYMYRPLSMAIDNGHIHVARLLIKVLKFVMFLLVCYITLVYQSYNNFVNSTRILFHRMDAV